MSTPSLELKSIDGHTLMKVLAGIQGPISIKVCVNLPTEEGHESDSIRIYTDHNCISRLKLFIEALGQKNDLELQIFDISLSEHTSSSALEVENIEEIKAPVVDKQKWAKMPVRDKQRLILKTVQSQLLCGLGELSSRLEVARSHVSNVLNGKRNLGWKALNKLMENFPLSIEMKELVKATMREMKGTK